MKQLIAAILLVSGPLALHGQGAPDWLNESTRRTKYPESAYFTGFAYGEVSAARPLQEATQQVKTGAQADLSQKIRVHVTSRSQSEVLSAVSAGGQYRESETFTSRAAAESSAEVVGVKTETHYDAKARLVYAFAYASRRELTSYYKACLAMYLAQAEGLLQTARSLEAGNEKAKARRQLETAKPLFAKVRYAQDMLTAVDVKATAADLRQQKTEQLYSTLTQMQARLAQGVYVYVESEERNFTRLTTVVENQLKATLAKMGCSFVHSPLQADFQLYVTATTRHYGDSYGFSTCYADVRVSLVDTHKKKSVFKDEFSQKGVAITKESAGRKALEDAVPIVAEKISLWIEN